VPSRKTMADPSMAAARVARWAVVTARVYRSAANSRSRGSRTHALSRGGSTGFRQGWR
jgi:hypothetical protein